MSGANPIERAIAVAGSQSSLSRILNCTPQNVQRMCSTGHVPAKHVLKIESATGVSRHDLRPDIYPDHPPTLNANVRPISTVGQSTDDAGVLSSSADVA